MEYEKFNSLIISYLEESIQDKDLAVLLDWLDDDPANRKFFYEIKDIWDAQRLEHLSLPAQPLWKKELQPVEKQYEMPRWRRLAIQASKYAAVIAITIVATVLLQHKQVITKETAYHQVLVQNGKQSQLIILSDGTRVWINASSSLKYPGAFDQAQRTVWLDGEAYFEVAENAAHPFVVRTGNLDIKVLGTHFNVTAYSSDPKVTTTLVEGKVELWTAHDKTTKIATLEPNQQAVYLKDENKIELRDVNPGLYIAWKDGYYRFFNTSFNEIAGRLEKMYHVKITFDDESLSQISYTGTFVQEQSIREVLEIMRAVKPFTYKIKNQLITIKKDMPMDKQKKK